ncbi:MAG: DUF1624 domain-containing protein, partial [Cohaesibacteraceae bacterium]
MATQPASEPSSTQESISTATPARWMLLDQARGAALIAMIIYHAAWNAVNFGLVGWTIERDLALQVSARYIAGTFLVISGIAIALAAARINEPLYASRRYWRRLTLVAAAALLVTGATIIAIPNAPIYFGVLHQSVFTGLVLAALAHAHAFLAIALGALVLIGDSLLAVPALNHPRTIWRGLGTRAPITADWVPVFPWLAAGRIGFGVGKAYLTPWLSKRPPQERTSGLLGWTGHHSLAIYLIHQPI